MVDLTRLNNTSISINPFQVETMEETPDTVIMFTSGRKIVVKEKIAQIKEGIENFFVRSIAEGIKKAK
ncbi:MAG: hypothetical protein A2Y33_09730 [Spirochaetes bacterium GWF1_51_8]|nr:MAG: hypothetical protein A2Y33_09730 [Spirochaetes bacterium GWF1_51_8]